MKKLLFAIIPLSVGMYAIIHQPLSSKPAVQHTRTVTVYNNTTKEPVTLTDVPLYDHCTRCGYGVFLGEAGKEACTYCKVSLTND